MRFSASMMAMLAALMQLSSNAIAQDFLQQLDARTEDAASRYNSRFIDEHLYFAKRHRIVEINTPMLRESRIDGVTLFEGEEKIDLRFERVQEGQIHGAATWIGSIVLPPVIKAGLEEAQNSGSIPEQIVSQIGRLELQLLYWDIDLTTGEAYPSAERRHIRVSPTPVAGAPAGDVEEHAFTSVGGQIDLSILGRGIYRLVPLGNSPRYHILYEVDPSKTFGVAETDPSTKTEISDEGQKQLNYDEFLKSLPPRTEVVTKGNL